MLPLDNAAATSLPLFLESVEETRAICVLEWLATITTIAQLTPAIPTMEIAATLPRLAMII
jgi:hypothetical protein